MREILAEAAISIEIELKLAVETADLAALTQALAAMAPCAPIITRTLVTTYFDTPQYALRRAGSILRVREEEGRFVQALKTEDGDGANLLARGEWEDEVADNRPDLHAARTAAHLPPAAREGLQALFVTEVERAAIEIKTEAGTRIEAAVDRGTIRAAGNDRWEPISEVELELKAGDPAALYSLAAGLLDTAPLRIETRSKSERGYRLAGGEESPPAAVSAKSVALHREMTVEDALQRVGRACLAHLLRNEPAALVGGMEGIHQMRVATRRLRAMLSAVKKMLPEGERRRVLDEIKTPSEALGPARNLDVLISELLPAARAKAPDEPGWDALVAAAQSARAAAYRHLADEIRAPRHAAAMLRLLGWFEGRGWRQHETDRPDPALGAPLGEIAPDVLEQRRRTVAKRGRHFRRLSARDRHRVRIAVKKLRYTTELLSGLYDRRDVRSFVKGLKRVQDELGYANDVRVAYGLVIELARAATPAEEVAEAGSQLLAHHQRRVAEGESGLRRCLRRLKRAHPFWPC